MPLRFIKDSSYKTIPVSKMRDGQIGEIVQGSPAACIGRLAWRFKDRLFDLEHPETGDWQVQHHAADWRVRVIPNGKIEVEVFDNE